MSASFLARGARSRVLLPSILLPLFALAALLWLEKPAHAAPDAATCTTSGPGAYAVTVCIDAPAGATLSGNTLVSATVSVTATNPAKVIFHLDNKYLLTDYEAPYRFTLPTAEFGPYPGGSHTISVTAYLRDGFQAAAPLIQRTFANASAPSPGPSFTPRTAPAPPPGESVIVAVAGDGAGGETAAAQVGQLIESWNPDLVLYTGDVYERGSYTEFINWYGTRGPAGTFFGRFYDITNPVVGNHEYLTPNAAGYFKYWNGIPNYYSYDAGGWHFIALNSTSEFGQIAPNKPQFDWLLSDLANNTNPCTIAYFHHPVLSVGKQEETLFLDDIWNALAKKKVDIVFVGHDHSYQRWKPLNSALAPDPQGTTYFVVGNSGHGVQNFITTDSRLAAGFDDPIDSFGALQVRLNPKGAEFRLYNTAGALLDQGVVPCTGAAADTTAPTTPQNLAVTFAPSGYNLLTWDAAWDETGVAAYAIYRNGSKVATVGGGATSYLDTAAPFNSTYVYTVAAVDPFDRTSLPASPAAITRPAQGTLTLSPVADTYVEEGRSTPFGHLEFLRVKSAPPAQQSYLRFDVQGTEGHITGAKLRLFSETSTAQTYNVHAVADTSWIEGSTVYTNAPALGAVVGGSGSLLGGGWRETGVSGQVEGDGLVSFGLSKDAATTPVRLTSREAGPNAPQLVVTVNAPAPPPPTAPGNLQATAPAPGRINLTWSASSSSNGVESYVVRRNGADLIALGGNRLAYTDTAVAPDTTYAYTVVAVDYNGAQSPPSNGASATTLPTPPNQLPTITLTPVADTYVSAPAPGQNFGTSAVLRADAAPERVAYLRFDVQGLAGGAVTKATLRLYAIGGSVDGYQVHTMDNSAWSESGIAYANRPGFGAGGLSSTKNFAAGTETEVDVTALIKGDQPLNLAVTAVGDIGLAFHSRSGQHPPELVVERIAAGDTAPVDSAVAEVAAPRQTAADADDDGVPDDVEALNGTNPNAPDSDGDGMDDLWEIEAGMSPISSADADGAGGNPDNDDAFNADEHQADTDPFDATSNPASANMLRFYLPLIDG